MLPAPPAFLGMIYDAKQDSTDLTEWSFSRLNAHNKIKQLIETITHHG